MQCPSFKNSRVIDILGAPSPSPLAKEGEGAWPSEFHLAVQGKKPKLKRAFRTPNSATESLLSEDNTLSFGRFLLASIADLFLVFSDFSH